MNGPIENDFDIWIAGADLIDGSGGPRRRADIGIRGDRIEAIALPGATGGWRAPVIIDGTEHVACPGFIDSHTHDDNSVISKPDMVEKISQGVTTVITGNCGISLAPLIDRAPLPPLNLLGEAAAFRFATMAEYVGAVEEAGPRTNVAALVGHATLRVGNVGDITRKATEAEISAMCKQLREGLAAGAIGFSTGLFYPISAPADIDEVVALAKITASVGGIYSTHMRNEHDGIANSLTETFETARLAAIPVVISHHKCGGRDNWGRSESQAIRLRRGAPTSLRSPFR